MDLIQEILVDMDGVVTNFFGAACFAHKKNAEYILTNWPAGETETYKAMGLASDADLFRAIDAMGENLWAKMEKYPWADYLWMHCKQLAAPFVCTSPSRNASSSYGKVQWLQAWQGEAFRDYIITPHKHLLARPTRLLIDDFDKNCDVFRKAGGHAILFPRPWNENRAYAQDPIKYFMDEILEMADAGLFRSRR
jgi:hypothetical protein